ncbi:MAG: phosphonatase-like hydrolase [Sediminicola sp.]|tara:strand:+ start:10513 stop:11199 length:687 start_codon:yes stop_codon:yes gene_type:complete
MSELIIELAVFDMAGTTVDEKNVVYKTLQKAINEKGYGLSLDFVLEHGAGKEKHQAIKDILERHTGKSDPELAGTIFTEFQGMLKQAYAELSVGTYVGVEDLMDALRMGGVKIALNTGYDTKTAQLLLDRMKWTIGLQYDALITADDVEKGRPAPDMILKAMEILQINDPSKVLKVGDSIIDIEEGKNLPCGMTVGVTTGAHTRKQLASAGPTFVLDSLWSLRDILLP